MMRAAIDRFGRIVLPKKIRDRHGLVPGSTVEIEDAGDSIVLNRLDELPGLVEKDGIMVFRARATGDLELAIRAQRDERLRTVRGPTQ
jgi:AbrB family looped-hinge helix DNA binding protein